MPRRPTWSPTSPTEKKKIVAPAVASTLKIEINPKARKSGRPKTDKKQKAVYKALGRVRFNAAHATRQATGVVTLQEFSDNFDADQPSPKEARCLLSSVMVKFWKEAGKRPNYEIQKCSGRSARCTW
jgi:hypothetical protein